MSDTTFTPYAPPPPPLPSQPAADSASALQAAKVTMILGIVGASYGVTLGWLFPFPTLILGIVGLLKRRSAARNGQATAGLTLGIINVSLGGLFSLLWTLFFLIGFFGEASSYI